MEKLKRFIQDEEGQGMTEYALIIALVVLVGILGATLFAEKTSNMYQYIINNVLSISTS